MVLDWAGMLHISQHSRIRAQGADQTREHLMELVSCCLRVLGLRGARGHSILLAPLVFCWTYRVFEDNDGWKRVLSSSCVQNELVPCCHSLQERSLSMTFQLSNTSSISHFWWHRWSAETSGHEIFKKKSQLIHGTTPSHGEEILAGVSLGLCDQQNSYMSPSTSFHLCFGTQWHSRAQASVAFFVYIMSFLIVLAILKLQLQNRNLPLSIKNSYFVLVKLLCYLLFFLDEVAIWHECWFSYFYR